jgi:hypothetical protein
VLQHDGQHELWLLPQLCKVSVTTITFTIAYSVEAINNHFSSSSIDLVEHHAPTYVGTTAAADTPSRINTVHNYSSTNIVHMRCCCDNTPSSAVTLA